jgi:hypothetical protein
LFAVVAKDADVAVDALPDKVAVIVPALKFPEALRATTFEAVLASVASTANVLAVDPLNVPPEVKYVPAVNAAAVAFAVVAVVAVDALPVKAPTNVVEVTLDNPAIVVADDPNDIEVDPTVTALFAKLALVMPAVPDRFEFVNPDIDPPKVTVPVPVIGPPVNVMPDTVPAVDTDVTVPLPPAVDVIVIAPEPEVIEIPDPAVKPASVIPDALFPINTFPLSLLPPVNIAPAVMENGAADNDNEAVAADVAVPDTDPCNEPVIEVATIFVAPNWPVLGLYVNEATVPSGSVAGDKLLSGTYVK